MEIIYMGAFRLPNLDAAAPRVLNNAKVFRKLGHKVRFISWGGQYRSEDLCEDGKYRVDGFEYIISGDLVSGSSLGDRIKAKFFRGKKSIKLLKTGSQPEILILYNADYIFTLKMLKYCKIRGIKLVNDITEWYDNNELKLTDILLNYLNMTKLQYDVRNKILISSFLNEYYKESNNIVVPPLCDKSEIKWKKTLSDERVKSFDGITLIYAGNPGKKDCVHTVINAVNALALENQNIRFMILGIEKTQYLKLYYSYLTNKNLHENIIFLGRVSQDSIPAYYKMADFMVLLRNPNRKSMAGFPTKFAESMTAGVPVITNATSDLPKYVVDGETGFLVDGYDYNSVLSVLRNKVLVLDTMEIERMKQVTCQRNQTFDIDFYTDKFRYFVENIQ